MEQLWRRRGLILLSLPVLLIVLLRKQSVQLASALILYWNARPLFGVTPYTMSELLAFFTSNIEATIGFFGIVIAFAAGRGFIESKQLDLRLSVEGDIAKLSEDASALISVCRRAALAMIEVERLGRSSLEHSVATNSAYVAFPPAMGPAFRELADSSRELPQAQRGLVAIGRRFGEITRKSGPVVRSNIVTAFSLERAEANISKISEAARLIEGADKLSVEEFLYLQSHHRGATPQQLLDALKRHELRFQAWMGGASAVGAGSIFTPSIIVCVVLWFRLWSVRE